MAKKTVILDDLDGGEGAETCTFALNGQAYEIDLAPANQAKLEKALKPFVEAGHRKANGGGGKLDYDSAAVRAWAAEQGIEVNPRGRIATEVVEAWRKATQPQG